MFLPVAGLEAGLKPLKKPLTVGPEAFTPAQSEQFGHLWGSLASPREDAPCKHAVGSL